MTLPAFLFGFCVSSLIGGIFHLWRGGGLGRLLLDLTLSWFGFGMGQFLGSRLGWGFIDVGPLHLGIGVVGNIILLTIGHWLSLVQVTKKA